jgi:ubiquinone/menaquinone biosynthesis C-methylase UbiE
VLEVGSGVGYILQAALRRLDPSRIIGLDVAQGMIDLAKARLARDNFVDPRVEFLHYDGINIPLPDGSIDYVYSIAVLQHIPKIYVYNLLMELYRILKPSGYCSLQTFAFSLLLQTPEEHRKRTFAYEVAGQLSNGKYAWITYYCFEELLYILSEGLGAKDIHIVEKDGSLWFSFCKTGSKTFHHDWLPDLRHIEIRRRVEK